MKLALALCLSLGLPAIAAADTPNPPDGPVYVDDAPADARPDRAPRAQRGQRAQRLRRALVAQFDANGDGKLGPRERLRAARVLGRIQARLAGQRGDRRPGRQLFERYDVDRDGTIGPDEMPRGAADRLRRFDRDGDGWLEPGELRGRRR